MAIPPANQPQSLKRSIRYWAGGAWRETPVSARASGGVFTGSAPIASSIVVGFDTQENTIHVPVILGNAAHKVTGVVTFPNIGKLIPQAHDGMQFHVDMVHIDQVPAGLTIQFWNITPQAQQGAGGPDIIPGEGFPTVNLKSGLAPGVNYQSFSAIVQIQFINTQAVNSPAGDCVVHLSAKLINAPG